MGLVSMTGFARTEGELDDFSWILEIKSVNGKGLDLRTRLPQGAEMLEQDLKKLAAKFFKRGNFQLNLQVDYGQTGNAVGVNETVLEHVLEIAEGLRKRLDAPPLRIENLLGLRGVLETKDISIDEETILKRNAAILDSAEKAFAELAEMRVAEGARMATVINAQLEKIEQLTIAARDCPDRQTQAIKARFKEQIDRLLETSDQLDPDRLHTEAVLIATKADVQEELDRLFAHVSAARELLASKDAVGRKFDFLAQEFNREANTLCSKASSKALSHIGLEMKTTIDQLREQVQNIE